MAALCLCAPAPALAGVPGTVPAGARGTGAIHYVYVIPLSHLDIGFTNAVPDVIALEKQYLDDAMDYAEQYPEYRWTIENVWQLDQWLAQTSDPAQVDRLRGLIAQGRIEVTAGYANMHQGVLGYEQFNRFLYPARNYESAWGLDLDTAVSDDVPGSSLALPQILRKNGVRNLLAGINTAFGGRPDIPLADSLFTWRGIDGSEVLVWMSIKSYAEGIFTWRLNAAYDDMASATQRVIDAYESKGYAYDSVVSILAFDNDGADTIIGNGLNNVARWNAEHTWPQIIVATPKDFFDHVRATYGDDGFHTYTGDWSGLWENNDSHYPVTVQQDRWSKDALPQAETLAALRVGRSGASDYPQAQLDQSYRDLLVLDEHSGPGGGNGLTVADIDVNNQWFFDRSDSSYATTRSVYGDEVQRLASDIATNGRTLVVYNGWSWSRSDLVTLPQAQLAALAPQAPSRVRLVDLATGRPAPMQLNVDCQCLQFLAQNVPALGYKLYAVTSGARSPVLARSAPGTQIENAAYRVVVDAVSGNVTSLYDKRNGRELVDAGASTGFNELIRADQQNGVVWGVWEDVAPGAVTTTVTNGPLLKQLTVTRAESPISETIITLATGLARVELRNRLEHDRTAHADQTTLNWWYYNAMPFALGSGFTGRFESPNGWLVAQDDWMAGSRHNVRVVRHGSDLRGADGYGVTVANRETYLQAYGSLPWWDAGAPDTPVLYHSPFARDDGAPTADQGWVDFPTWEPGAPRVYDSHFALTSTPGGFDAVRAERFAAGYGVPMQTAMITHAQSGSLTGAARSLLAIGAANVELVTMKRAEFDNADGRDLILRLQEIAGQSAADVTIALPFTIAAAEVDGLGEQRDHAIPLPVAPLRVSLAPHETLTVRLRFSAN
jgi:alpha-mannosidase